MKKVTILTLSILFAIVTYSQTPSSFKYQTVVRDASGYIMANHDISLRMSILEGSMSGGEVYVEEHYVTTNEFGLVNINIGEGNTGDDFSTILWGEGLFFIKIEMDENAGSSFVELGVSQLLSVPYAMYANDVLNKDDADANPNNELQTLSLSNDDLTLTDGGSVSLSQYSSLWEQNGTNVYYNNGWVGVGTDTPSGKMVVQGDAGVDPDSALFEVKNKDGQTIFAVYDGGVRIWVDDTGVKANTDKGGFAVGGYRTNKSISNEYLRVTPDSLRMYFDNQATSGIGHSGGFAIQSFNGVTKTGNTGIMYLEEDNYFIGESSGINVSTGSYNSTFGFNAGQSLTTADRNVFLGYLAGASTTEGNDNVFIGNEAGGTNSKGWNNVVVGSYAGISLDTAGSNNVIIGKQAGQHLSNGFANVFIGTQAGNSTTTGLGNVFIGDNAGLANDTGFNNLFMGSGAGYSNTSGANNIFLGTNSGESNTTGRDNNFIGYQAGANNLTGNANNFIGYQSGFNNQSGNENCYLGFQAGYTSSVGDRNIIIGFHAAFASTGSGNYRDNIFLGDSAGLINGSYSNIYIGNNAGQNNTQYENVYIGTSCARFAYAGQYNTYIGTKAGEHASGSLNSLFGNGCGQNLAGNYNAFFGLDAGDDIIDGEYNTIIGTRAGGTNVNGDHNTALGYEARINGEISNAMAIGNYATVSANNTVRIGNGSIISIGGSADWTTISDKRFKTNINDDVHGLDFILKLEPVTYNLDLIKLDDFSGMKESKINEKKAQVTYTGFLAQDVEKVAKELGYDFSGVDAPQNEKDHYGLRYATFVVPLVKAVQEQQEIIEIQKTEIGLLNEKLEQLSKRMELLENK